MTDGGGTVALAPPAGAYLNNALALVTATPRRAGGSCSETGMRGTNPALSITMTRDKRVESRLRNLLSANAVSGAGMVVNPLASWYPFGSKSG